MKNKSIVLALALLPACDPGQTETSLNSDLANRCLDIMQTCEDWEPVKMEEPKDKLMDCESAPPSVYTECLWDNRQIKSKNAKHKNTKSVCQQKVDACTRILEVTSGSPATVHNHYEK